MERGRPSEYRPEYINAVDEYLNECRDTTEVYGEEKPIVKVKVKLPTVEGFARKLGVNKTSLYEWEKKHPDFSNALDKIRIEQYELLYG